MYNFFMLTHQLKTKGIFILSSVSSSLQFWWANHTSIHKNLELGRKLFVEILNNWPNDLLGTNVYKNLASCWKWLLIIS